MQRTKEQAAAHGELGNGGQQVYLAHALVYLAQTFADPITTVIQNGWRGHKPWVSGIMDVGRRAVPEHRAQWRRRDRQDLVHAAVRS